MRKIVILWVLFGVSFWFASCKKDSTENGKSIELQLDELCDSTLQLGKLPGMIVGVWDEDKNIAWTTAKGKANTQTGEAMTIQTTMKVGSITKTFVSTVLLQLCEEGQLSLNDKLSKYFPQFPKADSVTLRMLCNMTSGIPDYTEQSDFIAAVLANPEKEFSPEEIMNYAAQHNYLFSPGSKCVYSNTNYIILGRIIELKTQKSLAQNLKERIFDKMNMVHTQLADTKVMPAEVAHGYMDTLKTGVLSDVTNQLAPSISWATGGVLSRVEELKTWSVALSKGALLQDSTFQRRITDARVYKTIPGLGLTVKYGYGVMLSLGFIGHAGMINGYSSIMMTNPDKRFTIVILYNKQSVFGSDDDPSSLFLKITSRIHPELFR